MLAFLFFFALPAVVVKFSLASQVWLAYITTHSRTRVLFSIGLINLKDFCVVEMFKDMEVNFHL